MSEGGFAVHGVGGGFLVCGAGLVPGCCLGVPRSRRRDVGHPGGAALRHLGA